MRKTAPVDTVITILVFGVVALSAIVCVVALISVSGKGSSRPRGATPTGGGEREELPAPLIDDAWHEAQAVVAARNARRRRRGEPELDPDVEAAEILRGLEDELR